MLYLAGLQLSFLLLQCTGQRYGPSLLGLHASQPLVKLSSALREGRPMEKLRFHLALRREDFIKQRVPLLADSSQLLTNDLATLVARVCE